MKEKQLEIALKALQELEAICRRQVVPKKIHDVLTKWRTELARIN